MKQRRKRFQIAFSFAGEKRDYVSRVAGILAKRFGRQSILYDKYHEAEFARRDLGIYLPNLYHEESDLIVVVVCPDYEKKDWCGLEWIAIHALLKNRKDEDVMLCRFEYARLRGLFDTAGWMELDHKAPREAADLILERFEAVAGEARRAKEPRRLPGAKQAGSRTEKSKGPRTPARAKEDARQAPRLAAQGRPGARDIIAEFQSDHRDIARANPELLRIKIARMALNPWAFFRGASSLFARDILSRHFDNVPRMAVPTIEIGLVGKVDSESFGAFQAEDGQVHYDVVEFDEATHGGFEWDVCRLATSMILAAQARGDDLQRSLLAAQSFLSGYCDNVHRLFKKRQPLNVDASETERTDCRAVDDLIKQAASSKRSAFIRSVTEMHAGRRRLLRRLPYFDLPAGQSEQARRLLHDYRQRRLRPASFYDIRDICGRIAGMASLGCRRYVILITGRHKKGAGHVLLEFKQARASAYDLFRKRGAEALTAGSRAEQVTAFQQASQASPHRYLGFAVDGEMSFQVREFGPRNSRLNVTALGSLAELQGVARLHGEILARVHCRSAAREVGDTWNPLLALDHVDVFSRRVLAFALAYAERAEKDWQQFVKHRIDLERREAWPRNR
jgi:uncharacterized protein (DUF2252 family)